MVYNLFLDDIRFPEDCFEYAHQTVYITTDWIIVRSYDEFVKMIETNGVPYMVSIDHDLGIEAL